MYSQIDEANDVVQRHMDLIITEVARDKFDSLVLFGSYSHGEGGFYNGNPVNDYDLLLVGGTQDTAKRLGNLKLPVVCEVHGVQSLENIECTQQWYEIKHASKLLRGSPLWLPDWKAYDIPYSDAVNSLEKRAMSMLIAKHEMMKDNPDYYKVMAQIGKMIIALGDAILIKRGQFSPSYRTRALMLGGDIISQLYNTAVSHKVIGFPELNKDQIWNLWNTTRATFRDYYINNDLNLQTGEVLLALDETISRDDLKQGLINLGQERWL